MTTAIEQLQATASPYVTYVATALDPYIPTVVKDGADYALKQADGAIKATIASDAFATASTTVTSVYTTVNQTATQGYTYAVDNATAAQEFTSGKVAEAVKFGTFVVDEATKTVTAITPDPVLKLVHTSLEGAQALRADPVGAVKPYVPEFVVQAGEKTYEVVLTNVESARKTAEETTGFIVTKVNGVVDQITHIPQVESLLVELKKLVPAGSAVSESKSESKAAAAPAPKPKAKVVESKAKAPVSKSKPLKATK